MCQKISNGEALGQVKGLKSKLDEYLFKYSYQFD